ncbi:MAG: amino acid permease [Candidatus Woesearchaeota archaeon]
MAELEHKAGYGLIISLSITAMIGTGMYFGPAIAAGYAGNASIISWALLAAVGVYVGACFAELSSLFPDVGGVYQFAKKTYGRFPSFLVGWVTWLVGSVNAALLIVAAVDYLLPNMAAPLKLGLAIGILILLSYVAYRGVDASTAVLLFFAGTTILVILSILITAAFQINPANYTPLFSPDKPPLGVLVALFFIFETFLNWESPTFMGGETRNPQKVIPKSIMITSILTGSLVILFPLIILGLVPWETLTNFETPLMNITYVLFGPVGADLSSIAVFIALIGAAAGGIVSTPRLLLALAKDKLFIEQLSHIHRKRKTPHKAIFFQTLVSLIVMVAVFGDYESILALIVPLAIFMYIAVILAVPILRRKYPDTKRYVKAPFGIVGPILVVLFYLGIIAAWLAIVPNSLALFQKVVAFVLFGLPIYALINIYYNPDLLTKTINTTAILNQALEPLILPKRVRKDILRTFSDVRGKDVLEFGSGVGAFTLPLADAVGDKGRIYALDLSPTNIRLLDKRLEKRGHKHVTSIHDEHFISRVHPDVPSVDMVFSVGSLSYVQDPKRVLQEMNELLPENGQVCFVEYTDYFGGLIPDKPWLDDPVELRKLFREAGFSVRIRKRRGLFWRYLYVYGIKSKYDVPVI